MLAKPFEKPVPVWVGLGFPRYIRNVAEAYQMLMDWRGNSPEQKAAIRACKAALLGDIDAETARGVFLAFARKKDLLVEEGPVPVPSVMGADKHV
jgi:hypothetical protein